MILDIIKIMNEIKKMFPFLDKKQVLDLALRTYNLAEQKIFYSDSVDNKNNLTQDAF